MEKNKKRKRDQLLNKNNVTLSLADKGKLIAEVKKSNRKKKEIAEEFGILPSTLTQIMKNEGKILNALENGDFQPERKRMKLSSVPAVEKAMQEWTKNISASNNSVPISGEILRDKASFFASSLGVTGFKSSKGWSDKFKKRNGLTQQVMSGESAAVSEEDCTTYRTEVLPGLLADYSADDVFNADEFGLFFKCLPNRTLSFKGQPCHGGKLSKERITVLAGANMSGTEKLKLLVIGKSANPRCFKNVKSLPVTYKSNKKA